MVPVNYFAVILAAILEMALGFAWYGPLFGRPWRKMMHMPADMAGQQKGMAKIFAIQALGALLMAFIMAHALIFASAYLAETGVAAGIMVGFANWIGFVAPVTVGSVLWENKPWKLWFINAGYYLVSLILMGILLSLWA
jgi:hypothetical protein